LKIVVPGPQGARVFCRASTPVATNWRENHDPPQATIQNGIKWQYKVCLASVPDCDQNISRLSFSEGYNTWASATNNGSENTIYAFNNDLTWIKGRHAFKMGGMYHAESGVRWETTLPPVEQEDSWMDFSPLVQPDSEAIQRKNKSFFFFLL
jgi:hypothetical protein